MKTAPGLLAFSLSLAVTALLLGGALPHPAVTPFPQGEFPAPTLLSPQEGETVASFGPDLTWRNPPGAAQVHLQVIPSSRDGPGVDILLGSAATSFRIPPPPEWYGLLPDMTYTWRVRTAEAAGPLAADDPIWGPWAERTFRTPAVSSASISLVAPPSGAVVATRTPELQWRSDRRDLYYYEVQVSKDPEFGAGLFGPWAPVIWQVVHGGLAQPPNTYRVPAPAPLDDNSPYYWRVRPRVQGDGKPVGWSFTLPFYVVVAAGRPAPTPAAAPPPPPGKIAFTSSRDGNPEVYVMKGDGSQQTRITDSEAADLFHAWSPDGSRIAFTSNRTGQYEIYVMNADGSGQVQLTTGGLGVSRPVWSPDGSRIAFWAFADDFPNTEIYVMRADGAGATRLTHHPAADIVPTWSPDGARIAFASRRDGDAEIYVMNSDGSGQRALTRNSADDTQPAWSPRGAHIAFVSDRDGNPEVYVMSADGSGQARLTDSPYTDEDPRWSPDGRKLLYRCTTRVCIVPVEGGLSRAITGYQDGNPTWSPDGVKIAYECGSNLCVVNADGSRRTHLTQHVFHDWDPVWSPR